jgi:hypothetical protein
MKAGGIQLALLSICFRAGILLDLYFDPEYLGDIFLRNTEADIQRTAQLYSYIPEDRTLHNHRCENLKFFTNYYRKPSTKPHREFSSTKIIVLCNCCSTTVKNVPDRKLSVEIDYFGAVY